MKKYFSPRFYLDALIRLRTFTLTLFVIFSLFSGIMGFSVRTDYFDLLLEGKTPEITSALNIYTIVIPLIPFVLIIVPMITLTAFNYLMKRNESDFYETLPITREAMLISTVLAVFTVSVFLIAVPTAIGVSLLSPCIGQTVAYDHLRGIAEAFGLLLASLLGAVATSLAVSMCGNVGGAAFTAIAVIYIPRAILGIINESVKTLCPSLVDGHIIPLFDNRYNLITCFLTGKTEALFNPLAYVYTLLLTVGYFFLALLLFKKRRSEFATHSFTSTHARHFASLLYSVIIALFGILIMFEEIKSDGIAVAVIFFLLASVMYFCFELFSARREKNFRSTLKAYPILPLVLGVFTAVILLSGTVTRSFSPKAEDIKHVGVLNGSENISYNSLTFADYVTLCSENVELSDERAKKIVAEALKRDVTKREYADDRFVTLKINTGLDHYRTAVLTEEEYGELIGLFAENDEYKALWMNVGEGAIAPIIYAPANIVGDGAKRVIDVMRSEVAELGFDAWYEIYKNSEFGGYSRISYSVLYDNQLYSVDLNISEQLPKTYAAYIEERDKAIEAKYEELKSVLTAASVGEGDALNLNLTLVTVDYYEIYTYISDDDDSRELVNTLFELVSSEGFSYDDDVVMVSISVHGDDYDSFNNFLELSIPEENIPQVIELFKKFGS